MLGQPANVRCLSGGHDGLVGGQAPKATSAAWSAMTLKRIAGIVGFPPGDAEQVSRGLGEPRSPNVPAVPSSPSTLRVSAELKSAPWF